MSMRARLEDWIHEQWSHRGPVAIALSPLSVLFYAVSQIRRRRAVPRRLPVPVVVVGNIYVGGTGKTPVTISLVESLVKAGFRPGIISRGYGRSGEKPRIVLPTSNAADVGDEPLLISMKTNVPVAVGRDRHAAGELLLAEHPEIDVILSDDGLQHFALERDVEIAVVGARGLGNGWVLPAGPLREGPSRLDEVDAIVLNTTEESIVRSRTPRYVASSCFGTCTQLATGRTSTIDALSEKISEGHLQALAAAGIASPGRFFAMVKAHDIDCRTKPLGDHFDFDTDPFSGDPADVILITAKDAVKCRTHPVLKNDPRLWVVGLEISLDPYLIDLLVRRINAAREAKAHPAAPAPGVTADGVPA